VLGQTAHARQGTCMYTPHHMTCSWAPTPDREPPNPDSSTINSTYRSSCPTPAPPVALTPQADSSTQGRRAAHRKPPLPPCPAPCARAALSLPRDRSPPPSPACTLAEAWGVEGGVSGICSHCSQPLSISCVCVYHVCVCVCVSVCIYMPVRP